MCAESGTPPAWKPNPSTKPPFAEIVDSIKIWTERIGPATVLEIEVREPSTLHAISLGQVAGWLGRPTMTPTEARNSCGNRLQRCEMKPTNGSATFYIVEPYVDGPSRFHQATMI